MFATDETAILARLRERLPAGVTVEPLREIERVPQLRQRAPAAWVIYDGYRVGENVGTGQVQQVVSEWFVVIATKSARGAGDVEAARDEASALCEQVLEALLGHHLGRGRYLRLADAPGPEYDAGYCHVPMAFTCAATFRGKP